MCRCIVILGEEICSVSQRRHAILHITNRVFYLHFTILLSGRSKTCFSCLREFTRTRCNWEEYSAYTEQVLDSKFLNSAKCISDPGARARFSIDRGEVRNYSRSRPRVIENPRTRTRRKTKVPEHPRNAVYPFANYVKMAPSWRT